MKFTSILKKALMALTGLALVGFLVSHLLGNLYIYAGSNKFNAYAKLLENNPQLIIPAEIGLILLFLAHIFLAIKTSSENNAARPVGYDNRRTAGESTLASRTMWWSGLVIAIFVVVHVWGFKFGTRPANNSLWELVKNEFQRPGIVAFYVVSMLFLGLHLSHAIASAFQSLGLLRSSGHPRLGGLGPAIGWGLALGFALLPIYLFVFKPAPDKVDPLIPHVQSAPTEIRLLTDARIESGK